MPFLCQKNLDLFSIVINSFVVCIMLKISTDLVNYFRSSIAIIFWQMTFESFFSVSYLSDLCWHTKIRVGSMFDSPTCKYVATRQSRQNVSLQKPKDWISTTNHLNFFLFWHHLLSVLWLPLQSNCLVYIILDIYQQSVI